LYVFQNIDQNDQFKNWKIYVLCAMVFRLSSHGFLLILYSDADLIFLVEDLYDRIPTDVESKLMPFQREGIRCGD
jgi:hypothetical protein